MEEKYFGSSVIVVEKVIVANYTEKLSQVYYFAQRIIIRLTTNFIVSCIKFDCFIS